LFVKKVEFEFDGWRGKGPIQAIFPTIDKLPTGRKSEVVYGRL
jgi:hypothetical protein